MKKILLSFLLFTVAAMHSADKNTYQKPLSLSSRFILGFKAGLQGYEVKGISSETPNFIEAGQGNALGLKLRAQDSALTKQLLCTDAGQAGTFEDRFKGMIEAGTLKFSLS